VTKLIRGRVRRIEKARGRDALLAVSLALVYFVLSGCADPKSSATTSREEPHLPPAEADIHGIITKVGTVPQETNGDGGTEERVGVVLVEDQEKKVHKRDREDYAIRLEAWRRARDDEAEIQRTAEDIQGIYLLMTINPEAVYNRLRLRTEHHYQQLKFGRDGRERKEVRESQTCA
jgi:hypothetical protein